MDEAPSGTHGIATHIVSRLRELPIQRIRLRIACRTALWIEWLGQEFEALWQTPPTVLELLPLRRRDVRAAAKTYPVDADAFLREVFDREIQALASQPLTLDLLLKLFAAGPLPTGRTELYRRGLLKLVEDSPSRRGGTGPARLSASQRLAVAERIAACILLAGADSINTGAESESESDSQAALHESALIGGTEGHDASVVMIDQPALRETFDTGLFNGRGAERLSFAHHSYAEFLAASWLAHHELTTVQIYDLIGIPASTTSRVAPQWYGVAAWLASIRTDILDTLLREEPEALVDADVGAGLDGREAELVAGYLRRVDSGLVPYPGFRIRRLFSGLDGVAAENALRTCINDGAIGEATRRLAIHIACDSSCLGVLDDLVRVALDPDAPGELRADAAHAICRIGDSRAKAQLLPLATDPTAGDEKDELRGAALACCWPEHMTCGELLAALCPRRNPHHYGLYERFLNSEDTVAAITADDLPQVLRWLARQSTRALPDDFERLRENIVQRAANRLHEAQIADAMASFVIQHISAHAEPWAKRASTPDEPRRHPLDDPATRRCLIAAVATQLPKELHPGYLTWARLVWPDDFAWSLDQVIQAPDESRWAWLRLAHVAFQFYNDVHWRALLEAQDREPRLREWLPSEWLGWRLTWACSLTPEEADPLRIAAGLPPRGEEYQQQNEEKARRLQWINDALSRAATGDPDGWEWFVRLADESAAAPVDSAFWSEASPELKRSVLDAALAYLDTRHLSPATIQQAIKENSLSGHAVSTFAALKVVTTLDPARLRALPAACWREWFPVTLWFARVKPDDTTRSVVNAAWAVAPGVVRRTILRVARRDAFPPFDAIEAHWDDALSALLLRYIKRAGATAPALRPILQQLLRRQVAGARELAAVFVSNHAPDNQGEYEASIAAAQALLVTIGTAAWSIIGSAVLSNPKWGIRVLIHHEWEETLRLGDGVSDHDLCDLVRWFIERFPPERDVLGPDAGPPTDHMRSRLIDALRRRGTEDACAGLRKLEERFPHHGWLRQVRLAAEATLARASWKPIRPETLLRMAASRKARRIESGEQLLSLLVESLRGLQRELHGTPRAIRDLWDRLESTARRGTTRRSAGAGRKGSAGRPGIQAWRPLSEPDVSDWIARGLRRALSQSGIVVNREVVIRQRAHSEGEAGQRTDILVELGGPPTVAVIIEVKGSWHPEICTAMESQLINRYLRDNQCRHGLYLVAWFHCDAWKTDERAPFESIEECREFLTAQAQELNARSAGCTHAVPYVLDCRLR